MVRDMTEQPKNEDLTPLENEGQKNAAEGKKTVVLLKNEYDDLLRQAEELQRLKDRYLRSAADFDNAKKRFAKEREQFFKFALEGIIFEILPVLDNFERALLHLDEDSEQLRPIRQGFELIYRQLLSRLEERGLKQMKTIGQKFDPHIHEAVEHVACENKEEGTILEEVLTGYELCGKLIRHPKVKITGKQEPESAAREESKTPTPSAGGETVLPHGKRIDKKDAKPFDSAQG